MSSLKKRQNNLRKAQIRFDKVSKNGEQFKLHFERSPKRRGKFRTKVNIVRGEKHYNGRGLIHKAVGQRYRIEGDAPSITRTLNSLNPHTKKGKLIKGSALAINFVAHGAGKTAVNTALAAETLGIKAYDTTQREVVNSLKQKYSREAVDDYHRGTLETLRIGADAVKGTRDHFRQKKQFKLEKAKYRLKKAEYDVFREDKFKPAIKKNNDDLKSAKAEFKQHKRNYKNSSRSNIQKALIKRRKQAFGYDVQGWNVRHCNIKGLHEGVDVACAGGTDILSPFKGKIKSYDSNKKTVILRKDDVEYWYDGTGGTKRDTEVTIINVKLKSGYGEGDTLKQGEAFAESTTDQHCDDDIHNDLESYIHIKVEIDTDGIGWDFIDPRLVFY